MPRRRSKPSTRQQELIRQITSANSRADGRRWPAAGTAWSIAVILIAGALAYANSLGGPFILDDTVSVVQNASIRDWREPAVLAPPREIPTAGRPLVNLSLAINYAIGGLDVRGYHAW